MSVECDTTINYVFLSFGFVGTLIGIISEVMGYVNKWKDGRCTSITEFLLKSFHLIKPPTLEEKLSELQEKRRVETMSNQNLLA